MLIKSIEKSLFGGKIIMTDKCSLCGNRDMILFHKGVRDKDNINVLKCEKCGLLQLSQFPEETLKFYEDEQMHIDQYNAVSDTVENESWDSWVQETKKDDDRRFASLKDLCYQKDVLDFGCGNGGFLNNMKSFASSISGVELDKSAREKLNLDGITVVDDIDKFDKQYDIITMFQVIEHLENPQLWLTKIHRKLREGGYLIIETPNANDALIQLYHSQAFRGFTFWSVHLMLYNSYNLEMLVNNLGFETINNGQIQRYPLSNHLFWLSNQKPGGHEKWDIFNGKVLNQEYEKALRIIDSCDTLYSVFRKKSC